MRAAEAGGHKQQGGFRATAHQWRGDDTGGQRGGSVSERWRENGAQAATRRRP